MSAGTSRASLSWLFVVLRLSCPALLLRILRSFTAEQGQEECEEMIDGLDHLGMRRRLRAHDVMFEANVDQAGREQPRHFARIRRRDQAGKRKAAEIVRHQALFARIELIGEFCADARHAVAFRRDDLLELVLARIRPLGDEIERELTAEGGGLPAQLSIARLFQAARRTGRPMLADDGFEDRRLAREMIVKAAFADTHPARQLAHRGAAITAFGKQMQRFRENPLAGRRRGHVGRVGSR